VVGEERIVVSAEVLVCAVVLRGRKCWVWVLVVLLWALDEFVRLGMRLVVMLVAWFDSGSGSALGLDLCLGLRWCWMGGACQRLSLMLGAADRWMDCTGGNTSVLCHLELPSLLLESSKSV